MGKNIALNNLWNTILKKFEEIMFERGNADIVMFPIKLLYAE